MSKAMPKELKKAIREVLEEALDIEVIFTTDFTRSNLDPRKQQAADHLIDLGFLQMSGLLGRGYVTSDMLRATAHGREYWEELTAPRWYWFRHNWFPASVAAGTILFAGVAAAANIVNLVL